MSVLAAADAAATVLARAFAQDPLWLYLLPDPRRRILALRESFRATMPWYIAQKIVTAVGDPPAAIAVWRPAQSVPNPWPMLINPNSLILLFSPFLPIFGCAIAVFNAFERMHRQYVTAPHYYLSTIGVLPEAQGRGYGSQLIRSVLRAADHARLPAYTETMTPTNVPIYEHYGFVVQEHYRVPETSLRIWSLYRPAPEQGEQYAAF